MTKRERSARRVEATSYRIARGALNGVRGLRGMLLAVGLAVWLGVLGAGAVFGGRLFSENIVLWALAFLLFVTGIVAYLRLPGRLDLGADGVLIDARDEKRFVPFEEIEDAATYQDESFGKYHVGVELRLAKGEAIKVSLGPDQVANAHRASDLARAIKRAVRRHHRAEPAEEVAHLARQGRSATEWAAAMKHVGSGANAGPRDAPLDRERLLRIAESSTSGASERAGAAAALVDGLDDDGRKRLRIAAEEAMAPGLSEVLTSAAEGNEAEVAAALGRLKE